jgi:hypothetical protein
MNSDSCFYSSLTMPFWLTSSGLLSYCTQAGFEIDSPRFAVYVKISLTGDRIFRIDVESLSREDVLYAVSKSRTFQNHGLSPIDLEMVGEESSSSQDKLLQAGTLEKPLVIRIRGER